MTKIIVAALFSALAFSAIAGACTPEAQYIGNVKNVREVQRSESLVECFYQIDFTMFNPSYVCPLVPGEASGVEFQDYTCSLKDGDFVSGYLARYNDQIVISN